MCPAKPKTNKKAVAAKEAPVDKINELEEEGRLDKADKADKAGKADNIAAEKRKTAKVNTVEDDDDYDEDDTGTDDADGRDDADDRGDADGHEGANDGKDDTDRRDDADDRDDADGQEGANDDKDDADGRDDADDRGDADAAASDDADEYIERPRSRRPRQNEDQTVAVFIDLENIYYSVFNQFSETLDWPYIVDLCRDHGRIASIQAFGDWINFQDELRKVLKNGIQPIFVPQSRNGKSSLDCYLIVSAMKLFFQNNNIDTMILASGDRDYIPLIAELKALGRKVKILAIHDTLSTDLRSLADGIIEYEARTEGGARLIPVERDISDETVEMILGVVAEVEEGSADGWANLSEIGNRMKKKYPDFNHKSCGYDQLVDMLNDITAIELKYDDYAKTIALARVVRGGGEQQESTSITGTVFSIKEGYGFIAPDPGGDNIFFHYSKVKGEFNELMRGDRVTYSTYQTDRGLNAEEVEKIIQ